MMRFLVTGGAGFVGSHLCESLVGRGHHVVAIDNLDPFYDPEVKRRNLAPLRGNARFRLVEADICDPERVSTALDRLPGGFDVLIHLAARTGVRASVQQPELYTRVNVDGTVSMLELARTRGIRRFVFGSSSSVYGSNEKVPFAEADAVDRPISPYAATKRAAELLCHTYHHLFGLSVVCLRFFTVYGPRQRPDLAIHKFTRLLTAGAPIPVYGDGTTERDYTYIDDILQGIWGAIELTAPPEPRFEIVNLGESETTSLQRLIELISTALGVSADVERLPMQPGDLRRTRADISRARALLGYEPATSIEQGIPRFVAWFRGQTTA